MNQDIGTKNLSNREKWLKKTLRKIPKGKRLLDAGAGELQYKKYCQHLNYVSCDFAAYDGTGDGQGLQTKNWDNSLLDVVADVANLPFQADSFDAAMCIEVFEHLPNPEPAIQEFSRILKKGGYLIITSPFASLTHFAPYHFATGFNKYYYTHFLHKYNFEVLDLLPSGNYFEYLAQEIRRVYPTAKQYSKHTWSWFDRKVAEQMVNLLGRIENTQKGSEELLCYGYHVFARKK